MNSAKKLLQFNFNANTFSTRTPKPKAIPKEQLATLKKIIETHDGSNTTLPEKESLRQVYRQFIKTPSRKLSSEFDSIRRIRQLAWTLTYAENEEPRIVDTPKLKSALHLIESRFRISMLYGIFNALLQAWDTPNAGELRSFLKKQLNGYTGSQKFVQKLKMNIGWYCEENGATNLAMYLIRSPNRLSDVWTFLELPNYMHSYAYFSAVATAYTTFNNQIDIKHVKDVIEFVKKHDNDKVNRGILSKLIEKLRTDAAENLRQPVQSYVLQEWQDPRIAGADIRWRDIPDGARQIFTQWLTKEDLRFFFDVVAKACNDQKFAYRKAFWLAYFEHITFCRPVLHRDAEYLFGKDPKALQYYRDRRPAELKGGNRNKHAFIIRMGDFTFVEFSTVGACYVYHNADLPFELGDSEYHITELSSKRFAEERVIHNGSERYSWQDKFALWLENETGIKNLRSYRLDGKPNPEIINPSRTSRREEKPESYITNCPNWNCQQKLRVPVLDSTVKLRCPKCKTVFEW
ncbi:MAG: EH signature domain-containing protein [Candidatus Poribacteria bacterium]|nr:EH signature domain-containing protein [Candidatus Poribacteria bacterium]